MDRRKQVISKSRMLSHYYPFFISQWPGLEQNPIRDAHLTNIMQQRTPAGMNQFLFGQAKLTPQLHRQLCYPLCMTLGFVIA